MRIWILILSRIKQGEIWRVLTGQWVHFGFNHSLMNALGLAIVQYSFLDELPLRSGCGCRLRFYPPWQLGY